MATATSGGSNGLLAALTRKKPLDERMSTNLNRCLNLLDLITLGVGSTLGLGLYVLAGQVASTKAGPGVVISFALAALASAFSALCYAEFAGRVPRAGSAYAYSYITVGEFVAFIIGWNLILEYIIGASSVARGFSGYLRYVYDKIPLGGAATSVEITPATALITPTPTAATATATSVLNLSRLAAPHAIVITNSTALARQTGDIGSALTSITDYLVKYFDWPSVVIVVVLTVFILFGVKESTNMTLAFTSVNMLVIVTVLVSSLTSLDLHNWRLTKEEVPMGAGEGGFLPFGWSGVLAGSATCFFGFIGFDTIASSAEEARNPRRNVPLAIVLSLFISFVAYMCVALVQTLLWPYYDQDNVTVLPYIFEKLDMPITYWVVLLGATAGLASSQLGGMYPLPRILFSIAQDRLIYGYLAHVNKRLHLPVRATIIGSILVAVLACLLDIQDLADMVSIGTLAAYSLVSVSVLIIRYEDRSKDSIDDQYELTQSSATNRLSFSDILLAGNERTEDSHDDHESATPWQGEKNVPSDSVGEAKKQYQTRGVLRGSLQPPTSGNDRSRAIQCPKGNSSSSERPKLLDLLIVWRRQTAQSGDIQLNLNKPDDETSGQSKVLIALMVVLTIVLAIVGLLLARLTDKHGPNHSEGHQRTVLLSSAAIVGVALVAVTLMLSRLPTSSPSQPDMFQVPLVPVTPMLSLLVNTFLMLNLSYLTWVRFGIWMAIGLSIYFTYGIRNSRGYLLHATTKTDDGHRMVLASETDKRRIKS